MKVKKLWSAGQLPTGHVFEHGNKWCHVLTGAEFDDSATATLDYWECVETETGIDTADFFTVVDDHAEQMHCGIRAWN